MIEVVAELGINHNGDLDLAKKMIDVAAAAGCHYVKFQKRDIDLVYTKEELDKPRESPWGTTTREQKQGLEFSDIDYIEIALYCEQKKIKWFASPWDYNSVKMLTKFDIPFIKVPSALVTNTDFLEICGETGKPIILSSGMSTLDDVRHARRVVGWGNVYCVMQCTSTYPTAPNEVNVSVLDEFREAFPATKIGFSNHYPGLMAMIMAATLGYDMLEFHLTLDRTMYGSDQAASIEPKGVFELMSRLRLIEQMKGTGVKNIYPSELPVMAKLRR